MAAAVRLHDVTLGYERHPAIHHLSGEFKTGSLTAVVGPNGAGKSTLLKGMVGSLKPMAGHIELAGDDIHDVAYLPQQAALDRSFPISVLDMVCLGHWRRIGLFRAIKGDFLDQARAALDTVGLGGFEKRPVGSLSGGQLQRALFARMLIQNARILLLDEPFTAIDARTTADLLDLVHHWHGEQRTIVAVLHDLDQVQAHFPQTLLLAREALAWGETQDVITSENLRTARHMCEAWDDRLIVCQRAANS